MEQSTKSTPGGTPLESMEHRDLLDIIDKLRSQGIGQFVDLPQIIVCGDQSSGKSSVLEAISGMSFPTKDNLCTRFATELILRRSPSTGIKVNITPGPDRSSDEKKKFAEFKYTNVDLDMSSMVEAAKEVMGLNGNDRVFSTDILRVEISGPTQPHLTMVDLPGLFLAGNKDQTAEDSKVVESLVLSYMRKERSIILAVVSAKSDFALQQVTQHARALDPKGFRTLGLITKPDTLDEGSDSEQFFVELAQNKDVNFRLGWHVLRNRNYLKRDATTAERNAAETEFFSKGIWTNLNASQLGVAALRTRLSTVLRDQILMQLPSVLKDIQSGIGQCRYKLAKLGVSRKSLGEQRRYLLNASSKFTLLTKAAIDGQYTDMFFASTLPPGTYPKRLRAVVQNTLVDFAEQMRLKGHAKIIQDAAVPENSGARYISRSDYVKEVRVLMRETRGRELPGTYNPLIVSELFAEHCKPWHDLIQTLVEGVLDSAYSTVNCILRHVIDDTTAEALFREVVGPTMEGLKEKLANKVDELLEPHLLGHPITYNHYLTENVQNTQAARNRNELEKRLNAFFNRTSNSADMVFGEFSMKSLLNTMSSYSELDMDAFSCSMATDMMQAYYKVALKKVIDDVSILAIESCLIQNLPSLLSPNVVCDLTDDTVQRIAGESKQTTVERASETKKLGVLEAGMIELRCLTKHNVSSSVTRAQEIQSPTKRMREEKAPEIEVPMETSDQLLSFMPEEAPDEEICTWARASTGVDFNYSFSPATKKKKRKGLGF